MKLLEPHRHNHRLSQNKAIALLNQLNEATNTVESQIWKRRTKEKNVCKHILKNKKICGEDWCCKHNKQFEKCIEGGVNFESYYSKRDIRDLVTPSEVNCLYPWLLDTPKSIREHASNTAVENRKTCISNIRNGHIKHFKQKFLSKKNMKWTMGGIEKRAVRVVDKRTLEVFPSLNLGYFKTKENLPETVEHDCAIHFDGAYYYIIIPMNKQVKDIKHRNCTISGDPGVREFLSLYDGMNQEVISVGDSAATKIYQLLLRLDHLISLQTKSNYKKRKLLKQKVIKTRRRIENLQQELHWKTANWLCSNYKQVVIPHFGSKEMCKKTSKRKINTKTVRQMMVLGHCKFLDKLKTKAQEYNTTITIVDEINTTKRCGSCSHLQNDVKGKKVWKCSKCNSWMLRDANAGRNISRKVLDLGLEWQDTAKL